MSQQDQAFNGDLFETLVDQFQACLTGSYKSGKDRLLDCLLRKDETLSFSGDLRRINDYLFDEI